VSLSINQAAKAVGVGVAALVGVAVMGGCGSTASSVGGTPATSAHSTSADSNAPATAMSPRYSPFGPSGAVASGLTVVKSRRGTCTAHGALLPGTYLCRPAGPRGGAVGLCYPQSSSEELICVSSPLTKKAIKFTSVRSLAAPTIAPPGARPSIIELSDGQICGSSQVFDKEGQALANIGGRHATYLCDGDQVSAVYGPINESSKAWTVQTRASQAGTGSNSVMTVNVKRAWH
jgi:hypothetical protein